MWADALGRFDGWLHGRGMAEKTRRAYAAGLRAEEIVNLDVTDADPDAEHLRVLGKGSKTRVVPAGEPAWRAVASYLERGRGALEQDPEPALFISKTGRRLSTSDVRRRLNGWVRRAAV